MTKDTTRTSGSAEYLVRFQSRPPPAAREISKVTIEACILGVGPSVVGDGSHCASESHMTNDSRPGNSTARDQHHSNWRTPSPGATPGYGFSRAREDHGDGRSY